MNIAAVGTALPPHRHSQGEILQLLAEMWQDQPALVRRLPALYDNAAVHWRHLALPLARYRDLRTFGETNAEWLRAAVTLGESAIDQALARAGLGRRDIDLLLCTSVTGIASPSLDARLINRLGLRPDVRRWPSFGLGCVAGAAGIARAADWLRGNPDQVAVLLSVELCSLTFQRHDTSMAHVISTGLFGDGAAAVVIGGAAHALRGPQVVASRSVFYPDTEDVMGWDISERGFRIVLSPGVPDIARERLAPDVDAFLAEHHLTRADMAAWICHPGGPKVLRAMQEGLDLADAQVAHSWDVLAEQGNLSSTSVLMVLERVLRAPPAPGAHGLMLAMGPGFCSELVLLRW